MPAAEVVAAVKIIVALAAGIAAVVLEAVVLAEAIVAAVKGGRRPRSLSTLRCLKTSTQSPLGAK